jgi:hypothetical protein
MSGYEEVLTSISLSADSSIGVYTGVPAQPGSAVPNYGKMYSFVKVTGANQVGLCVAATDLYIGVLQNKPQKPGAAATVGIIGVTNIIVGTGGVNAGDKVAPDANGHAVTDATNGKCIALQAGVAGSVVAVLIR